MFLHQVDEGIELRPPLPQYAEQLFALVDQSRANLTRWMPWPPHNKAVADSEAFLEEQLQKCTDGALFTSLIFHEGQLAGVCGYNLIDRANANGQIGYWLGDAFTGRGIMTRSVATLIEIGRRDYGLERIEIRCATGNRKSRAIPERLGFTAEATLRKVEKVGDGWYDHIVYVRLYGTKAGSA